MIPSSFYVRKMKLSVFTNFSEVTQNWNADFLTPVSRAHSTLFLDLTHTYFICPSLNALLNLLEVLPNLKDILSFLRGSRRSPGRREYGSPLSLLHLVPLGGTCQVATAYSWVSVFPTWSEINPVLDTVRDIVMNVLAQHLPYKYASSDWAALTLTQDLRQMKGSCHSTRLEPSYWLKMEMWVGIYLRFLV